MIYDFKFNNYSKIETNKFTKNLQVLEDCAVFLAMLSLHNDEFCAYK